MSPERWRRLAVAGVLAAFVALGVDKLCGDSQSFDEGVHLSAGVTVLELGDHRLSPEHPPLPRLLAALPVWLAGARIDAADPSWDEASRWRFARRFLYDWNDADRLLHLARLPLLALGALLVLAIAARARQAWGPGAGLLALALAAFNPELLAHSGLVGNDLAVAAFSFFAVMAFERLLVRATPARLVLAGVAVGAALASKFSAIVLVAVLPALGLIAALDSGPLALTWRKKSLTPGSRLARTAAVAALLLAMAPLALLTVWLSYGLRWRLSPDPAVTAAPPPASGLPGWRGVAARGVRAASESRAIPQAFAVGVLDQLERTQERRAFLMGERSQVGWWSYFPLSFAIKTPLGLIGLLLLAGLAALRSRGDPRGAAFLLLPAVAYFALAASSRVAIGHRYLLPVYPFLLAAAPAALIGAGRLRRAAVGVLSLAAIVSALANHPHHLSYFNELIGGPANGYRYVVDSSVDWGQDLKRLDAWLDDERPARTRLSYFGTAQPDYYGLAATLLPGSMRPVPDAFGVAVLPGDLVAVSVTNLQGVYLPRAVRPLMERLRRETPVARIGASIHVYRATFRWLLRPDLADELGWLDQALASYREAVEDDVGAVDAWGYLGMALEMQGRHREALEAFAELERVDPEHLSRRDGQRAARDAARAAVGAAEDSEP